MDFPHVHLKFNTAQYLLLIYLNQNHKMSESIQERSEGQCYVALTHDHLDAKAIMDRVRSPKAGAIVLFAGT